MYNNCNDDDDGYANANNDEDTRNEFHQSKLYSFFKL